MQAEEWDRIKLVFEAALNLPEERRPAYLDSACAGDAALRSTVVELLANHLRAGRFLEELSVRIQHVFSEDDLIAARFRIVRFISGGGMGEVYEAFDEKLRVRIALKTLRPELTGDPQALVRFQREIRIAREVSHESICKVFDLVEHSDPRHGGTVVPCLTMQLIEGESLLDHVKRHRPLAPAEALPLIRQIASAIDTLHDHGIVHRDLKPSNVMLTTRNGKLRAIVTDFGLARAVAPEAEFFESKLDFQAGAPYFMAPELLRGGRPSAASDVYSLGLIIDEMVTQTRAFPAESIQNLYYQKLWEAPISPTARADNLPPQWDRAILRCLADDPGSRYARASDAVDELERAPVPCLVEAAVERVGVNHAAWMVGPWRRRIPWPHRPRPISLALAIAFLAAMIAVGGFALQPLKTSVAVFPIDNLTNRAEYNYLCKGITAEVMRRLTLIDGVRVIPYYEPRSKVSGRELQGRFSLEGLLQVENSRVRLTAQLTDNQDRTLVWSHNFEREIEDPLELQSDIAQGSVETLEARTLFGSSRGVSNAALWFSSSLRGLAGFQGAALPKAATTSSAAFDDYIRGRNLFEERTVPATLDAIRCFQNALRLDPGFALAKAALSDSQFILMDYDYEPTETLVARARGYAEDAVRLGPDVPEAYTTLAAVRQTMWDFAGAEEAYQRALRLNPRFSRARRWYAGLVLQFARYDEALEQSRQATELDPYDFAGQAVIGLYLYYCHRYSEAAAKLEHTLSQKELIGARQALGDVYFQLGLEASGADAAAYFAKAIQQADIIESAMRASMARSPAPSHPMTIKFADRMHAEYYTLSGHPDLARPAVERLAGDVEADRTSPVPLAMYYAVAGQTDKALDLIERGIERKDRQLLYLKVSPQFDNLRRMPRFQSLLARMRL